MGLTDQGPNLPLRDHPNDLRGLQKGHFWGQGKIRYQAKVCCNHDDISFGPIGGNWDQICFKEKIPPHDQKQNFRDVLFRLQYSFVEAGNSIMKFHNV